MSTTNAHCSSNEVTPQIDLVEREITETVGSKINTVLI